MMEEKYKSNSSSISQSNGLSYYWESIGDGGSSYGIK